MFCYTYSMSGSWFGYHTRPSALWNQTFSLFLLELPLSVRKLTKSELQPLVDKVVDHRPSWRASLMNRAGRLTMVHAVLSATPIYQMIAMDLPKWVIKAIDKLRRGFLYKGEDRAEGGNNLVSWQRVCKQYTSPVWWPWYSWFIDPRLGSHMRWLWLHKTEPRTPWSGLQILDHPNTRALFSMALVTLIGDGNNTKFWSDQWLRGWTIGELAHLFALIPERIVKQRSIAETLANLKWLFDIKGVLSIHAIVEYLQIWDLTVWFLQQGVQDQHIWKLSSSGVYSSESAYNAYFVGSIRFATWKQVWKS